MSCEANNDLVDRESPTVLVVDDESSVHDIVERWLSDQDCLCAHVNDAEAAWRYLQEHDVHLVTLDIRLPGRSGIELLHQISKKFPDTALVMLTWVGETQTAIQALTQGAWGYLTKPVGREELLFQVRRALERRRHIIEKREYTHGLEEKVREQTRAIRRAHEETIHRLVAASMHRDRETGAHIKRSGLYSQLLAEAAGWPSDEVEHIRLAAPMHDLGKIGIPDAILQKPGRLTHEEFEVMKTHTVIGARVLADSKSPMLRMAQEIALCHHERWDGTGYPRGLAGTEVPESARIVAIVDVYDSLIHDRIYRPALSEGNALAFLRRGQNTHFDPVLVDHFFERLPEMQRIAQENPDESLFEPVSEQVVMPRRPHAAE